VCPGLTDEQMAAISLAIEEILPQLPKFEVKRGRMKKVGNKEALVSGLSYSDERWEKNSKTIRKKEKLVRKYILRKIE
jgi:hypothetical protein